MLSGQFLMSPKSFLPRSLAPRCCNAIASAPKAEAEESAPRCAAQGLFGDRGQSAAGGQGWHFSVLVFCGFGFFFFGLHGHLLLPMLDCDFLSFCLGEVLSAVALRCAFR